LTGELLTRAPRQMFFGEDGVSNPAGAVSCTLGHFPDVDDDAGELQSRE
jgi:hypothetical protein